MRKLLRVIPILLPVVLKFVGSRGGRSSGTASRRR